MALAMRCSSLSTLTFVIALGCGDDGGGGDTTGASATGESSDSGPGTTGPTTSATTTSTSASTTDESSGTSTTAGSTADTTTAADSSSEGTSADSTDGTAGTTGGDTSYPPCDQANPCERGEICWALGDMSSSCGPPCTEPTDCPEPPDGTATPGCVEDTLNPGSFYCILDCEGTMCPTEMSCVPVGNSEYCFWPP